MRKAGTGVSMSRAAARRRAIPYVLIIPSLIFIFAFLAYPLGTIFYYSTQNYIMSKPDARAFVGLQNFVKMFSDKIFLRSLGTSAKWVLAEVISQLFLGMTLALLLDTKFKGRGLYRCIVFFPWAVSGVLTSMLWSLIYNQNIGLLNSILMDLGIITKKVAWLGNSKTVFTATVIAEIWRGIPFFAITFLAALQSIPSDLHEACVVDGGNLMQEIFYIKIPMLKDTIILTTLLRTVWEFNNVDLILTLTGGGPSYRTTTLTMYMTNTTITNGDFGYGSTLAVAAFIILLLFAIIYLKLSGFGKEQES
ncbi:MAG: sugar ABC transporter permease [Lachnospiraceae bacterium]|jgi:multiple sugar transport system permease protein|nr:sugar ABC transporter permease [Lachnospiraceae bacterium]MCH4031440.1 sugar ABC transporter permease [Lachnospiraceae bacterium]MCH4071007.1 sugar ABC transporter permease [Lachnospiraceae bacterium]MCH4107994.1 sugar ABC transporter permease [Lachnospiraceae bacterium]MCI1302462.1 sugar ABC transporter permease [Lachnospiraceae bacterium]